MKNTSNATAKAIIKRYLKQTGYADGSITVSDMYEMLRDRMGFGNPEAQCIIAALTLAGAQWKPSSRPIENTDAYNRG